MRDRVFIVALVFSALFHVSMVTVFSIGVWFEVEPVDYGMFEIVDMTMPAHGPPTPLTAPSRSMAHRELRMPSLDGDDNDLFNDDMPFYDTSPLRLGTPAPFESPIPDIQLPTVLAADLERLRLRELSLDAQARHAEHLAGERLDSWARFGEELAGLRDAIARIPLFERSPASDIPPRQRVSVPAEGFEAYIEWMAEPYDRQLLFSPPIDALWQLDPSHLTRPLSFVFRVGSDGRVREVMPVTMEDTDLEVSVARALMNYRFAPLRTPTDEDQRGTLIISVERSRTP